MNIKIIYFVIGVIFSISMYYTADYALEYLERSIYDSYLLFRIEGHHPVRLKAGSDVLFNGHPVGIIKSLQLDSNNPDNLIAGAIVASDTPIKPSTKAEITVFSTGEAIVDLIGGSADERDVLNEAKLHDTIAVLPATQSALIFDPPPQQSLWDWIAERTAEQFMAATAIFFVFVWMLFIMILYWQKPSWLIAIHERIPEPRKIENTASLFDKASFGGATLACWIISTLLLFCASRPRALDAWIDERLDSARLLFEQRPSVQDRRIALDLPVKLGTLRQNEPWTAIQQLLSKSSPIALAICGPGGAGKTTLALEIARRVMGTAGGPQLGPNPIIPLLVEVDLPNEAATEDGFTPYLAGILRTAVNENRRVTTRLTGALLKTGRILLIVDGLSERSKATQNLFNPERRGFHPLRLIITSRDQSIRGMNTKIETESIPSPALYGFISRYIAELKSSNNDVKFGEDRIFVACAQLKRLLGGTPCTPLLATMWAEEIAAPLCGDQPRGVASLMDNYVRRILLPATSNDEARISQLTNDAAKLAELELGDNYQPSYVTRTAALDVLRKNDPAEPERRFAILEKSRILESPDRSDIVRISPDPVAEHLVSRLKCEELGSDLTKWRALLDALGKLKSSQGFVRALAACAEDEVHGRGLPSSIRDQIAKSGI